MYVHQEGDGRMASAEDSERKASYGPGGRGFYGAVTVSERGQIVVPALARRDLGIKAGDKLLVLGDPEHGIALMKLELVMRQGFTPLIEQLQRDNTTSDDSGDKE
ncbi:AbrB/MazE/SpoVT family DNA-binding domain-containing protein [Streptomyces sp. LZ34]